MPKFQFPSYDTVQALKADVKAKQELLNLADHVPPRIKRKERLIKEKVGIKLSL